MAPTINHDDAARLLHRMREGDDPLRLDREETGGRPETTDDVRILARHMLAGAMPVPPDAGTILIAPITAHLLRHMGADPLAAAALCHAAKGLDVVDIHEGEKIAALMSSTPVHIVYADPLRWESVPGSLIVPSLPETVMATLAGRRLAGVLSHPALDGLDIDITEVIVHDGGQWMTLHLVHDHVDVLLGREGLAALRA